MLNNRYIFILFLFIIAIGTLTSASADDSAGDLLANASDDELGMEEINDLEAKDVENIDPDSDGGNDSDIIESDPQDEGDVLEATDSGTFTALQNRINSASAGSTITLYNDYKYNDDFKSGYNLMGYSVPGLNIRKSLTIDGNGYAIDGMSKSVLFYIEADNVKLTNIVFKNAYLGKSISDSIIWGISEAIDWNGNNAVMENCKYIGISTGSNVGAVSIRGDKTSIKNCDFKDTRAVSLNGNGNAVNKCNFTNCVSTYASFEVSGDNNKVTDCNFNNCHSKDRGGAASFSGQKNEIVRCSFVECSSDAEGDYYYGNGGAIYISNSAVVDHCSFFDTSASNKGGAIFLTKYLSGVTVSYCTFNNTRATAGGAIYRETADKSVAAADTIVNNCKFILCHANDGGAIFSNSTKNSIKYCNFDGCSADATGGAIDFEKLTDSSTVLGCDFNSCTSVEFGGAVYCYGNNGALTKCNFIDCNSEDGGAIYWDGISGKVSDSKFIRCTGNFAGAIDWDGDKGTLSNCDFIDCNVTDDGGAIYWETDGSKMTGCSFQRGNASYGGAVYVGSSVTGGSISDCNFEDCEARYNGGAIYFDNVKDFKIDSSIFSRNSADEGGAIASYNSTVIKIGSSTFSDNAVNTSGAAIRLNNGYGAQLDSCKFIYNNAGGLNANGGAISALYLDMFIVDSGTFVSNHANNTAGAIYLYNMTQSIVRYSTFSQNSARYAGAIAALYVQSPYVISSKFMENTAANYGGAVYGVIAANCDFIGNSDPQTYSTTEYPGSKLTVKQTGSYFNDKAVTVTLTGKDGAILSNETVNVTLNGKTSTYTTNSKGQITFKVNLVPKTYAVTVSYGGNSKYYASSEKVNVVVKKATPKLTAAKKTFKLKVKTKKYSIVLKNHLGKAMNGKKVSLTIKGKTYFAKTNSKGKATFKITKLKKKGKYTAAVKYGGDSYYNKVSKSVKIIVKK